MNSYFMILTATLLAFLGSAVIDVAHATGVVAPVVAAPAAIGYAKAIPYNIPPYASRIDISTRALAAPLLAHAAPVVAAHAAPLVAAHPAPVVAAHHAAPFAYSAFPAPLISGPGLVHPI